MSKPIRDRRGERIGSLIVVELAPLRRDKHSYWLCRCDCGALTTVRGNHLTARRVVSCGCWRAKSAVRQAARLKVKAARRHEIARLGGAA